MHAKIWFSLCVLALPSCSPETVSTRNCARVLSVVSGGADQNLASLVGTHASPRTLGGFLLVTEKVKNPTSGKFEEQSFRCAAQVAHAEQDEQILIWTADHCIDYRKVRSLQFLPFDPAAGPLGLYSADNSLNGALDELRSIRTALSSVLSEESLEEVMAVFMPAVEKSGEAACRADFDAAAIGTDQQRLCTSLQDLAMVSLRIPSASNRSPDLVKLLAKLEELRSAHPLTLSEQSTLKQWESAYRVYMDRRMKVGGAMLLEGLRSCDKAEPKFRAAICEKSSLLQMGLSALTRNWDPNATVEGTSALAAEKFGEIQQLWKNLLGDMGTAHTRLAWSGNFVFGSEKSEAYPVASLPIPARTAHLILPDLFGLTVGTSQVQIGKITAAANSEAGLGLVFTRPKSLVQLQFQPGDSGSLLMFHQGGHAFIPMGVLSTVDGNAVSGGLAMRPSSAEEAAGDADDMGSSNAGSSAPGTVVNQPKGSPARGGHAPCES